MAAKSADIDLIMNNLTSPQCSHGPTLLFERFDQESKTTRQFYACAAFRDRKACPFFQWFEPQKRKSETESCQRQIPDHSGEHRRARKRYRQFKKQSQDRRHICCTCGQLLLEGELTEHQGKGHEIKSKVSLKQLKRPSLLFAPLENNKTFAQYLFSKKCVDFIISSLCDLKFTHALCVGAPRIHEEIESQSEKGSLKSMLLDLDDRYAQLYPPSKFAKYNMFNHHFFEPTGKSKTSEFLEEGQEKTVLITDPPFGGMVEALVSSFKQLSAMWEETLINKKEDSVSGTDNSCIPTLWFFPYFMESRITSEWPRMLMLDYKVDYDNHSMYKNNLKQKGSPVRIFTNIPADQIALPACEGYWFCDKCQRFSSKENVHCDECGSCTSKDGTTYKHCDMCMKCVKPSRIHCFKCQQCEMQDHICGKNKGSGCHICGEQGHKRRDCPQTSKDTENPKGKVLSVAKRKMTSQDGPRRKKKR